ncbi:MAG: diguanylate cyclase (GGDEF)-like protein [Paraglaciecola sp.]|jgi:diguanylate cyclase (GGDEF)-like protein
MVEPSFGAEVGYTLKVTLLLHVLAVSLVIFSHSGLANEVDDFIDNNRAKTFDCPRSEMKGELDAHLAQENVPTEQYAQLRLLKSHLLICVGQYNAAQTLLQQLVKDIEQDKTSAVYAGAMYQLGFILDVQEDPDRCGYYRQAESLARDKFADIYLSAQLGQITVCNRDDSDLSLKLSRLFALLEKYLSQGDVAAIAHIHNYIGLLYGEIGQNVLASEQYLKAYKMGLSVYEEKNQMATLISLNSANMAAGDYKAAKDSIEMLRKANLQVNTPLTNVWLHYAESRYYFRLGDFEGLRNSLLKLRLYLPRVSLNSINKRVEMYATSLCVHDANSACVQEYLDTQQKLPADALERNMGNQDYLAIIFNSHFLLGNYQQAQQIFKIYTEVMSQKIHQQQRSGRVLGVANLHGEITSLESKLILEKQQRYQSVVIVSAGFILFLVLVYLFIVKRYISTVSADAVTGLPNERTLLAELKRVPAPKKGRTNALALCDVSNFSRINKQFGHVSGDLALKTVANCLRKITRDGDIVGRIGAQQFIVCLKGIDEILAKEFFDRILDALHESVFQTEQGERLNIESTMSIYMTMGRFHDLDEVLSDMRDSLDISRKQQQSRDEART